LALARALFRAGLDVHVFEARDRLGGRVLSAACQSADTRLDLGPTWYWPRTQPLMAALVEALELRDFPQHDSGEVMLLDDPNRAARSLQSGLLHAHARRLAGGMQTLVERLASDLPKERVHLRYELRAVSRADEHVALRFLCSGQLQTVTARTLVLAAPPRLLAERVQFEPALPPHVHAALQSTPTWMATQAKAQLVFERAIWREAGHSGNAFVQHDQAVLKEIFDACEPEHRLAALGAFVGLSPRERVSFRTGMPLLLRTQLPQLFGPELRETEHHYQDWAAEAWTCSERDLQEYTEEPQHPEVAPEALQQSLWEGRLHFAGSETADQETGYLEGALRSAARVAETYGVTDLTSQPATSSSFGAWLAERQKATLADYQARIFSALREQDSDRATQRALVGAVDQLFRQARSTLHTQGELSPSDHDAIRSFLGQLLSEVLTFNRRSCALSNFTAEHRPSQPYVEDMLRDVHAAYLELARGAGQLKEGLGA
jgi:monoamine oxidase